jgi:hypothetical protein
MNRSFVFTRAVLAVIGLLLVGPQKASAQTISACVNSATGLLYVVAANANCPPSSGNVTWTKTTLSTTPGVLAGAAYQCANQIFPAGGALVFVPSLSDINFGSAISTSGMSPWSSFLLQPGIYQIHFSGAFVTSASNLISAIVGTSSQAGWYVFPTSEGNGIMVGDRLISVSAPNTTLQMVSNLQATLNPACQLVITRLTLSPSLSGLAAPK